MFRLRFLYCLAFVLIGFLTADAQIQVVFVVDGHVCEGRSIGDKALFDAVRQRPVAQVRQLLLNGASPSITDDCGKSILAYAIYRPDIMKLLIDSGADVNGADPPLFHAISALEDEDLYAVTKVLIDAGAKVNVQDCSGETALMKAISKDDVRLAQLLVSSGADVNLQDDEGRNAYSYAAAQGNQNLKKLLLSAGAQRSVGVEKYKKEWGDDAFFQAAADGRVDVVEAMLASGAATVNMTNASKATALMRAHDEAVVDVLLQAGADVNLKNTEGYTALIWAAAFGRKGIVKKLISAGADLNARTSDGQSAIDFARGSETESLIKKAGGTGKKIPF